MSKSGSGKLLAVAVVWLILLGVAVLAYRLMASWSEHSRRHAEVARYEKLSDEARTLKLQPTPLPDGAGSREVAKLAEELEQRIQQTRKRLQLINDTGTSTQSSGERQRVRLALDSFSGYSLLRTEEFQKDLAAHGIDLELVDDAADYAKRIKTVQNGTTPLAVFTVDALVKASAGLGDLPATMVLVIDETRGADAMVAYKEAVPNLDALNRRDARIVVTRDSPSETLARLVLADFDLPQVSRSDVWIDAKDAADVFRQFKAANPKDPRAFVLWEPYVSRVLETPGSHVLIDSSKFRGRIVDVLVAERQFLLDHEPVVQEVVKAYLRAYFASRQTADGMTQVVLKDARRAGEPLTEEQATRLVQGIWWKNTQENYAHFGILTGSAAQGLLPLQDATREITGVLIKTGAIKSDPTESQPNRLVYDRVLRRLHEENFHPSRASGAGQQGETIRGEQELPPLTAEQWQGLVRVGTLQVESLVFPRGTALLTDQSQNVLRQLTATLKTWPQYYLEIRGNARKEGDPDANRRLAADRAAAAAQFLGAEGIPKARMRTVATEPSDAGGQAQSVSFVLVQMPY